MSIDLMTTITDHAKNVGDIVAGFVTVAVLAKFIPIIAGALSILWYLIRFYEWGERRFFKKQLPHLDE